MKVIIKGKLEVIESFFHSLTTEYLMEYLWCRVSHVLVVEGVEIVWDELGQGCCLEGLWMLHKYSATDLLEKATASVAWPLQLTIAYNGVL